jgi:alkaline phosphatase
LLIFTGISFSSSISETPKNIIILIGDGMGVGHITAAKIVEGYLNMERLPVGGLITTIPTGMLVTDSAASGTALATGFKTVNGAISMSPAGDSLKTVVEYAEKKGMSTGIVVTCSVTHATPAVFAAHVPSRRMHAEIASQIAASGLDVIFGGGSSFFIPQSTNGSGRSDEYDLLGTLHKRMPVLFSAEALREVGEVDAAAVFLASNDPPGAGRREISLKELTSRAIDILSRNDRGFFLMVEGSQIDWEAHKGNSEEMILEILDFDGAVGSAVDFASRDDSTLVIVTSDHETGGFFVKNGIYEGENKVPSFFGTNKHSANMVPLFAFGPGSPVFGGIHDNTFIGKKMIEYIKD